MTKVHHNTAARATRNMATLAEVTGGIEAYQGTRKYPRFQSIFQDAKTALNVCLLKSDIDAEFPMCRLNDQGEILTGSTVIATLDPEAFNKVHVLKEIGALVEELGLEIKEESGSCVPLDYKASYKERGNVNHCGDWLAKKLDGAFVTTFMSNDKVTEAFDVATYEIFLATNEVDMSGKWAKLPTSGQKGWQGRYRMNGRQKLEKILAARGTLILAGDTLAVPKEDLDLLRIKHPRVKILEA